MRKFDPNHAKMLLNPERRRWQDPESILNAVGATSGMTLADVGAGPGFFTLPAARRVGPTGKVYALDVEPGMIERVKERADSEGITNVEALVSQEDRLPLPDGAVDAALLVNVLHEALNPPRLLQEIVRVLRPAGVLAVVEWKKEPQEWGPPYQDRLAPESVEEALRRAGFHTVEPFEVGPNHYGLRAQSRPA